MSKLSEISIHSWINENQIKNEKGDLIEFRDHLFLFDIYADKSDYLCVMKAAQAGLCLAPETKMLTADLKWVSLDEVKVGTKIVGVDESHNGQRQGRKKRVGIIEAKKEIISDSYKLTLDDGRFLIATPEHRFLSKKRTATDTVWRSVKDFQEGDCMRYFCDVWGESSYEDGWMGGIIDGEGSLRRKQGAELSVVQTGGAVLERIRKYFTDNSYIHRYSLRSENRKSLGKKPIWDVTTSNTAEVFRIIGATRPSRFVNRTDWWEGACIGRNKNAESWLKVIKIEPMGKRRMIDIQTSIKTFVAEGIVSHNSTCEVVKNIYDAKRNKMDIIYTLPTDQDVSTFVGGKVNRIIAQNPILHEYTKDKDTIEQKAIGESMLYFRGTWTKKAAIMVTADRLVHDEKDSSKQDVVSDYQARLQHSKYKQIHSFSHPSVPGFGVDVEWKQSDQKHWFVLCKSCNYEQYLEWPKSIDTERRIFVCKKCNSEITREDRRTGRWVAKYKNKKYSGYWIPLLICPWITAGEIIDKFNDTKSTKDFFWNKVLGLPYVGSGNKVTQDMIFQNLTDEINDQEGRTIIGVDTGIDIRFVVGNTKGLFWYGQLGQPTKEYDPYDDLENMLKRWPNSVMMIDQGGDIIGSRKLREKYPGRVFLCHYRVDRKTMQLFNWGKDQEFGNVTIDRNRMIQLVIDEFTDKRIPIQGNEKDWYDYWLHWDHIYRVKELNDLGVEEYRWERSDRDDWVHCTVYFRVGADRFGEQGGIIGRPTAIHAPFAPRLNMRGEIPNDVLGTDLVKATLDKLKYGDEEDWRRE